MAIYFITPKTSETGKKFKKVSGKATECFEAQKKLAEELGASKWRPTRMVAYGGISSFVFDETPDKKTWKRINICVSDCEYMPKLSSKKGKEIMDRINKLPIVSVAELNDCIGFKVPFFKTIGFANNNGKYYGFSIGETWDITPPADCEEVTLSKYKSLFTS